MNSTHSTLVLTSVVCIAFGIVLIIIGGISNFGGVMVVGAVAIGVAVLLGLVAAVWRLSVRR